ncbi:MAG: hypothetical protein CL927_11470 [Deltaproteobacteria bacterium]|nr:hypothetical protein [Deltaproteobacteria bacterium]HCH65649.1 hypothetical protein [Deltaproteobacteria bacterium]
MLHSPAPGSSLWIDGALTPIGLLLVAMCFRLLPGRYGETRHWEDFACTIVAGLAMVGLGGIWLATFPLEDSSVITTSDFSEYCRSVAAAADGRHTEWSPNRSRLSGLLPILLSPRLGTQDALLVNAWGGQALLGAGLFLWGRSLHSPLAGIAAVLAACTLAPLVALGRMLTFYPVIVGSLTFSTGVVAFACRWPSKRTAFAAGLAVGLTLLVDLRGLLWAVPLLGLAGLRMAAVGHIRAVGMLWCALVTPIAMAWWWAPWAYPPQTTSLEVLAELSKGWQGVVEDWHSRPPGASEGGYVWGRSPIQGIPGTLWWLSEQSRRVPEFLRTHPRTLAGLRQHLLPLQTIFVGSAVLGLASLARHPLRLALLLGTCLPFALALDGAIAARFAGLRFLGNGMPFLALVAGIGFATVVQGRPSEPRPRRLHMRIRGAAALFFLFLVVVGGIDSLASPMAKWRGRHNNSDAGLLTACDLPAGAPEGPTVLYRLP